MFRLNPERIIQWLNLNGLIEPPLPADQTEAKAWLLQQMGAVDPYEGVAPEAEITHAVFGLVHSFSHLVLRQAVVLSGFDRSSLSEYLFPRALSFVLYSNNRSSFNIGGLHTLFEQSLHEHLANLREKGEACVYDPVCMAEGGSCHACLHVSEVSCEYFNRNLGRKYLFGRIEDDGNEYIGYWDRRRLG
jgi:hypothetical protein